VDGAEILALEPGWTLSKAITELSTASRRSTSKYNELTLLNYEIIIAY
jgi:hypothetical protein